MTLMLKIPANNIDWDFFIYTIQLFKSPEDILKPLILKLTIDLTITNYHIITPSLRYSYNIFTVELHCKPHISHNQIPNLIVKN